ncbi:histone-lysine N-methyltransferase ASH1L-like isoform X2 [Lampris incognitus]|uniref:histone-lysine N-methyltransferase ASH1L-like isoform X2 n=1 Tax=Lampris incognitus TaxID=2546036 RepID=UPI0024B4B518|nr:histone-lysine N-methyltransferase ASH1L-like isoform X2 [Lampris incognitus]
MDQRAKGGTPPAPQTPLASPPEDSEQDRVAERRRRGEPENADSGKREEERRGASKKKEGDKGAVLELFIEGRCGGTGQRQLPFPGRETGCPEGNVRLRIGLQAKRTKKPPKILESYVCKPNIRTYQRQGRGGVLRGDGEGGVGQQGKASPSPEDTTREPSSGLDAVQTQSKQTASAAPPPTPPPPPSSSTLQLPPLSSAAPTASNPASVPAPASPGTKPAKQVHAKLASKTEVNSSGSSEKVKREKPPSVNGQPVLTGHKPCSIKTDQTGATAPSTPSLPTPSAGEPRLERDALNKHNGLVQPGRQKGLSNGEGSADTAKTTMVKVGKHVGSTSATLGDADPPVRHPISSNSHKEHHLYPKCGTDSPFSPSATANPQFPTLVTVPAGHSQRQDCPLQPSLPREKNNKREKERKTKKEKRKEKKSKRDKGEVDRVKGEGRKEEGKKKKKEKEGKSRRGKGKDDRGRVTATRRDDTEKTGRGKAERKKQKISPDGHVGKDNRDKLSEIDYSGKPEKIFKIANPGSPDQRDKADETRTLVEQAEPAATGDASKSKEQDVPQRHLTVPPSQPSSPPSLPLPSTRSPTSPTSSPPEQDSRPLKKRKARRPSWTKLVHRAQRQENQETLTDSHQSPLLSLSQNSKACSPIKAHTQQTDESHLTHSTAPPPNFFPFTSVTEPPSPNQSPPNSDSSSTPPRSFIGAGRKRGRPKFHTPSLEEYPPRCSPKAILTPEEPPVGCEGALKPSVQEASAVLPGPTKLISTPRKRGRPPKRPLSEDLSGDGDLLCHTVVVKERKRDFHPEKVNRQLKIRRLISEMKKRKRKRLHTGMLSDHGDRRGRNKEADVVSSPGGFKSIETTATHTLSSLSTSFGGKLGPQINVSKRGTIYMGKRRGRKPKVQTAVLNPNSQNSARVSLFTNPSETSLFSNQPQPPPSHPFPSPSITHSSGAQSPYSEGSFTETASSSLLFSHPFSLPSPSSSCTSPHPPSSSSLSPFVKKSCPCQGRHHFPFHQSSCKLSSPSSHLHHTPGSPAHLKEATPSPRSESHSEETLPSDSGIGTDNNSVSERGELRGSRSALRMVQGSAVVLGGQRQPCPLVDRPSPVPIPISPTHRHTHTITSPGTVERHRERHRHRQREYDCVSSCTCVCSCPCQGHNKCTHLDYYPCLGHNALKRQKNKHKKKHQQLHAHDPEFLSELEDLIGQFSEVHIGRRGWARSALIQGYEETGSTARGRRHHSSSSHPLRSNIFRINLNGFYSPHPSSYPSNPSFSPQPFYPCQSLHCGRKPDRRQCSCPSKFQETVDNMGFYRGYPPTTPLYPHLHSSYPLPPPHQYAPHQPQHPPFLLNPARFQRRRSRLLREGGLVIEGQGDLGGGGGGGGSLRLAPGFTSSLSCGCGRNEHKHKRKHRHRHCEQDMEEEGVLEDEEEEDVERRRLVGSKPRSGFTTGAGESSRKGTRSTGILGSIESPWLRRNGKDYFSSAAAACASSSSTSSSERFKHTSLSSLGLGSSHLSSFGGGWGGIGQSMMKTGVMGGPGFGLSNPSWRTFAGGHQIGRRVGSDREEEDAEIQDTHTSYGTSTSPTHINLFTSAAMATGGKGLKSGVISWSPGSGDRSWRREELPWREKRGTGLQGDSRGQGQPKSVPVPDGAALQKKRGPGRPRKHPLPSPMSSALHSSATPPLSLPSILPGHIHGGRDGRGAAGRREERAGGRERDGGDAVWQVTELAGHAKRKKGQKRRRSSSPCHQSFSEDKPESDDAPFDCFGQSEFDQAPSQTAAVQRKERADSPPGKKFLRAGLYSDDYKTTDPPSQIQPVSRERESVEYTPGEHDYSLLPAPIHVGKYLRLKRIDFQLPYDVLWLWRNNQLHRQPAVPLKRKRHYCE